MSKSNEWRLNSINRQRRMEGKTPYLFKEQWEGAEVGALIGLLAGLGIRLASEYNRQKANGSPGITKIIGWPTCILIPLSLPFLLNPAKQPGSFDYTVASILFVIGAVSGLLKFILYIVRTTRQAKTEQTVSAATGTEMKSGGSSGEEITIFPEEISNS